MPKQKIIPIGTLIVDDQLLIIEGISALLADAPEVQIIGYCNDTSQLIKLITAYSPDVILLDLNMPGKDGIECLKEILSHFPNLKILMLTGYDDIALIKESLRLGAMGYILKNIGKKELINAITKVAGGEKYIDKNVQIKILDSFIAVAKAEPENNKQPKPDAVLSKREREVLKLIAEGKKSIEIAEALFISINTVDTHRKNILAKCEVRNTAELISYANKNRLI